VGPFARGLKLTPSPRSLLSEASRYDRTKWHHECMLGMYRVEYGVSSFSRLSKPQLIHSWREALSCRESALRPITSSSRRVERVIFEYAGTQTKSHNPQPKFRPEASQKSGGSCRTCAARLCGRPKLAGSWFSVHIWAPGRLTRPEVSQLTESTGIPKRWTTAKI
jgi:hypothetical protein